MQYGFADGSSLKIKSGAGDPALFRSMVLVMAISTALFGLAAFALDIGGRALVIGPIMAIGGPIIQYMSLKIAIRYYKTGANIFCTAIIACVVVWNVALGHGHSTLVGYALGCLAAGLLANLRTSLVYALVGLSVYFVIGFLQTSGGITWAVDPTETIVLDTIAVSISLVTMAVFLAINQKRTRSITERERQLHKTTSIHVEEREKAEKVAQSSEQKYQTLFKRAPIGLYRTNPEGRILDANDALARMLGYDSRDELIGLNATEFYQDPEGRFESVGPLLVPGTVRTEQLAMKKRDGTPIWGLDHVRATIDERGVQFEGSLQDITDRIRLVDRERVVAQIAQAAAGADHLDDLYLSIHETIAERMPAENCYVAIYHIEHDRFTFPYWVDTYDENPLSYTPAGRGLTAYIVRTGNALLATEEVVERLIRDGEVEQLGKMSRDWLGVPLKIGDRTIGAFVVQTYQTHQRRYDDYDKLLLSFVSTQIASAIERVQAVEAMRESEERYRGLIEVAEDLIYTTDLGGRFVTLNPAFAAALGISFASAVGKSWDDFLVSEARSKNPLESPDGSIREDLLVKREDGGTLHLENSAWVRKRDGRPVAIEGIARDITRRTELEGQLRHSQKMEAVGRLAGATAHDFNNLLTAINGHTELALISLDDTMRIRHELDGIHRAVGDAASLTNQLLKISRRDHEKIEVFALDEEIRWLKEMLLRLVAENIDIEFSMSPDSAKVVADRSQISQVIVNLVVNAGDAMPEGGCIYISLDRRTIVDSTNGTDRGARFICLSVRDEGVGIAPDDLDRVFEPFYTTKDVGKGTGLGLSTVYRIVDGLGGITQVESLPGTGSTFRVLLPEATARADRPPQKPEISDQGLGEVILVVDDDERVRSLTAQLLRELNYTVHEECDGQSALRFLRQRT